MLIICFRYRFLDEYPAEPFTEVYWIKFQRINSARYFRYKVSFVGLHASFEVDVNCRNTNLNGDGHISI